MTKVYVTAGLGVAAALVVAVAAQGPGIGRGGPPSRLIAALDADHDGTISGAERDAAAKVLATLDANADGRLTPDELRPAGGDGPRGGRGDGPGAPPAQAASPTELVDTLMAFDRNGDGALASGEVPERFQGLFARADADRNGLLTRDELRQSATATAASAPEGRPGPDGGRRRGDPLVRALDGDADGVLSAAEIAAAPTALAALDANGDGRLSADELRPPPFRGEGRDGGPR